jgi:hypothetical protein
LVVGWESEFVIATQVIIEGSDDGLFVYNGPPATGNLILSIASVGGTDPYGNHYLQGVGGYGNGGTMTVSDSLAHESTRFLQIGGGTGVQPIFFSPDAGTFGQGFIETVSGNGHLIITAPFLTGETGNAVSLTLAPANPAGTGNSSAALVSDLLTSVAPLTLAGQTWQAVSGLGSGWAIGPSGGTVQNAQYRIDAQDNLELVGLVHTTSTTPATNIFTLPAGFRPQIEQRVGCITNRAGTITPVQIAITTAGVVSIGPTPTLSSTDLEFKVTVPMGNIA